MYMTCNDPFNPPFPISLLALSILSRPWTHLCHIHILSLLSCGPLTLTTAVYMLRDLELFAGSWGLHNWIQLFPCSRNLLVVNSTPESMLSMCETGKEKNLIKVFFQDNFFKFIILLKYPIYISVCVCVSHLFLFTLIRKCYLNIKVFYYLDNKSTRSEISLLVFNEWTQSHKCFSGLL